MIKTDDLELIPCKLAHFEAILNGQRELEQILDVTVLEGWLEFPEVIQYAYEYLKVNPEVLGWWSYLLVHAKNNALIGCGGFKGEADVSGTVEIGYGIAPEYRNRGLATQAAQGLIDYAFSHSHIKAVEAHTLTEPNASSRVLEKIGMKRVAVVDDPDEGQLWYWCLSREDYQRT